METMERRGFLKLTLGIAAAAAVFGATIPSEAMPVTAPVEPERLPTKAPDPAVATPEDIEDAKPEQVQYRRGYWRRRWRWRRRYWRRRRWRY